MTTKRFKIAFSATATLELDDAAIATVHIDPPFPVSGLDTPEDIAQHIAFNMVVNHLKLSDIDGWCDQPDSNAKIGDESDWEVEVEALP
jgi:hypothetical protein